MKKDHDAEALKAATFLIGDLKDSYQEMGIYWSFVHEYQDNYCDLPQKTGPCIPLFYERTQDYDFKSFQEVESYVDDKIGDIADDLCMENDTIEIIYFAYVDMRVIYTVIKTRYVSFEEPYEKYIDQSVFNRRAV